jgi:hypothetical protein
MIKRAKNKIEILSNETQSTPTQFHPFGCDISLPDYGDSGLFDLHEFTQVVG